jgi:exo-beta-1,3-glucanase (GH17 family)
MEIVNANRLATIQRREIAQKVSQITQRLEYKSAEQTTADVQNIIEHGFMFVAMKEDRPFLITILEPSGQNGITYIKGVYNLATTENEMDELLSVMLDHYRTRYCTPGDSFVI